MVRSLNLDQILTQEQQGFLKKLDLDSLDNLESPDEKFEKLHSGRFTASTAYKLMSFEKDIDKFPDGAMTYVYEKVLETETENEKKEINSISILHGKNTEVEAVEEFMKETGLIVDKYGKNQEFIPKGLHEGCTPDGLIGMDSGLEVKCPDSKTHLLRLLKLTEETFKEMLPEYYWQVQDCMRITGRSQWYFVNYDPRFKNPKKRLHIILIKRNDDDIRKLAKRTFNAVQHYKKQVKFLRS